MGFFSGLGNRLQGGLNDGSLMNSLQMAGATARGDHASAASINSAYQRQRSIAEQQQQVQRAAQEAAAAAEQQRAAIEAALVQRGVPADQAAALSRTPQGASVLGSYNNQQAPDAVDRFLAANGYTDPNQPGYAEAEASARRFVLGQQVTAADGRGALAFPDIPTAPQYGQQGQPAPQPAPQQNGPSVTMDQFRVNADRLTPDGAARWTNDNYIPVRIQTPQDYNSLPSGTRYIDPQGIERIKP